MKTALFALVLCALAAGCSTVPQPSPLATGELRVIHFQGARYAALPMPIDSLKAGSLVAFMQHGTLTAGRILQARGSGVYRVEGGDLVLVSSANYVGQLVAF